MTPDVQDYLALLRELGYTQEMVWEETIRYNDMVMLPVEFKGVFSIKETPLMGKGVFAEKELDSTMLFPLRLHTWRTQLGRYLNHSLSPNFLLSFSGESILCRPATRILREEECFINYREILKARLSRLIS